MKTFALFLTAVATVLFAVATSQAALISLYEFEEGSGSTTSNSIDSATGTLTNLASFVAGKIGDYAYTNNPAGTASSTSGINLSGNTAFTYDAFGSNAYGFWSGTYSVWLKANDVINDPVKEPTLFMTNYNGGGQWYSWINNDTVVSVGDGEVKTFVRNSSNTYVYNANIGSNDLGIQTGQMQDGSWHLLTCSYTLTTGATSTGTMQYYLDGTQLLDSAASNSPVDSTLALGTIGTSTLMYESGYAWPGDADDFANWNEVLSPEKVAALANLGNDALNYGAKNADVLFNVYDAGSGTQSTSDGLQWTYAASGLGTVAGAVVDLGGGIKGVNLSGATGAGVQIVPSGPVTWTGASNTTWHNTANWNPSSSPDGVAVTFDNTATGTSANIASAATPTSVTFNASQSFSITGASFGIGGTATVLKQGTGTVTMSSANSYTGLTTLENGKLVLAAGAKTPVLSNAGVDVKFGKLVLDYNDSGTSPAAIDTAMKASYAGGNWTGGKFQSSTATTANTLGWKADTVNKLITVEYTLYGDANVDGSVNLSDLGFLGDNYGATSGATWAMGDFNYDGKVNLSDLGFLGDQYGGHVAGFVTAGPANPAPEPGTLALLLSAAIGLLVFAWRRRR